MGRSKYTPEPAAPAGCGSRDFKYKHVHSVQEDHKEPLYCVTLNNYDLAHSDLFATVGHHRATVYRLLPDGGFEQLQVYEDNRPAADGEPDSFYACKWSKDPDTGVPLLLLAGERGVALVIDVATGSLVFTAAGHGKPINDVAVHPQRPQLFLTASDDYSLRLWNFKSKTCVAIFAGEGGHRMKVLSLDFHPWDGHRFLSSGIDNAIKIWSLAPLENVIQKSYRAKEGHVWVTNADGTGGQLGRAFPTRVVQYPIFSTVQIHEEYVDCVRWMGDMVLSKSTRDTITMWRPAGQARHRRPAPSAAAQGQQQQDQQQQQRLPKRGRQGDSDGQADAGAGPSGQGMDGSRQAGAGTGAGTGPAAVLDYDSSDMEDDGHLVGEGPEVRALLGGEGVPSQATKTANFQMTGSLRCWFVRFSLTPDGRVLACGNAIGKVFVFCPKLAVVGGKLAPKATLTVPGPKHVNSKRETNVVRQTAVSWCGSTILAACQDGSVHRWERRAPGSREDGQGGSEGGSEQGDEEDDQAVSADEDEDMDE